ALSTEPVSFDDWFQLNRPLGNFSEFFVPGSVYASSIDLSDPAAYDAPMIESLAQLPPFNMSDIAAACPVMYEYLPLELPSGEEKRPVLVARTQELLPALAAVGKLPEYRRGDRVDCQGSSGIGIAAAGF